MLQLKNILSPEYLYQMATEFDPVIKMQISTDDCDQLANRLSHIQSIMATTGKMLADARYWRDKHMKDSILTQLKDAKKCGISPSIMNKLIEADCRDLNYLINWIEQQDKDCKYQVEGLRTLISLRKTEMNTFN